MATNEASFDVVLAITDRAGESLAWSPKYQDLMATTAQAVFTAHGDPPTLPVGRDALPEQIRVVRAWLESRQRSPKTADTYASAWGRVSAIVEDALEARAAGEETEFWAGFAERFRDPRVGRRRTRRVRFPPVTLTTARALDLGAVTEVKTSQYEVTVSGGTAVLTLPDQFNTDDGVEVVEAVMAHLKRARAG
jgi:hypothetical protein